MFPNKWAEHCGLVYWSFKVVKTEIERLGNKYEPIKN